eukprot:CAMPEP_0183434736 /NCGR_PEP_ID=MMETSP0370-20130417/64583_1 /TAXON_ID=268820 /ORGANISM="Peridinium aciculiferum, Strain PAER-2" /LENGTH=202 /DNA_ID=CAMNT_0025621535 /DNA_START=88 /DNA_END=696 /DNA_ORIENTATION=+
MSEDLHHFVNGHAATEADVADFEGAVAQYSWSSMLGPTLQTASGLKPTDEVLSGKKQVALFFAGSWCPWCRAFSPLLEDTIKKVTAGDPSDTEVVYITSDESMEAFNTYQTGKPWAALPYERSQGIGEPPVGYIRKKVREETGKPAGVLQEMFGLTALPRCIVLDGKTGDVRHKDFIKDLGNNASDGMEFNASAPTSWLDVQ